MTLTQVKWGGSCMSSMTGGVVEEIWSCSVSCERSGSSIPDSLLIAAADAVIDYHTDINTQIAGTERLDYVEVNNYDISTGAMLNDPARVNNIAARPRGAGNVAMPITTSVRVSLDDGTRNRRAKGGWFLPRFGSALNEDGRLDPDQTAAILATSLTFVQALRALESPAWTVGVWSRVGGSFITTSRLRVGDVPDDISRRKNHLRENYAVAT